MADMYADAHAHEFTCTSLNMHMKDMYAHAHALHIRTPTARKLLLLVREIHAHTHMFAVFHPSLGSVGFERVPGNLPSSVSCVRDPHTPMHMIMPGAPCVFSCLPPKLGKTCSHSETHIHRSLKLCFQRVSLSSCPCMHTSHTCAIIPSLLCDFWLQFGGSPLETFPGAAPQGW